MKRWARSIATAGILAHANAMLAAPSVTFDLQATGGTGGTVISNNKSATVLYIGDTVEMELHVIIGDDGLAEPDGVLKSIGSFLSGGPLLGSMSAVLDPGFAGLASSPGSLADLDADTDLDVGSNNDASPAGFYAAVSTGLVQPPADTKDEVLGTVTFTYTGGNSATLVNYRPRVGTSNTHQFLINDALVGFAGNETELLGAPLTIDVVALPGDADGDGDVDDGDLGTVFSNYTGPVGAPGNKSFFDGDTDGDGDVDDSDLANAFSSFTGPLFAPVPEPTTLALLGLGGLLVARRR